MELTFTCAEFNLSHTKSRDHLMNVSSMNGSACKTFLSKFKNLKVKHLSRDKARKEREKKTSSCLLTQISFDFISRLKGSSSTTRSLASVWFSKCKENNV